MGHVGGRCFSNFNACQKFVYKNSPPEGISSIDYRRICQTYGGVSHYATLYNTSNRIPVFSEPILGRMYVEVD